jgi:hypothetical protein
MGKVTIRYYVTKTWKNKDGRHVTMGYWQPTKKMKALGFGSIECGEDGPTAHQIAQRWNEQWQRVRRGFAFDLEVVQPHRKIYPARTVGSLRTLPPHSRMGRQETPNARGLGTRLEIHRADLRHVRSRKDYDGEHVPMVPRG